MDHHSGKPTPASTPHSCNLSRAQSLVWRFDRHVDCQGLLHQRNALFLLPGLVERVPQVAEAVPFAAPVADFTRNFQVLSRRTRSPCGSRPGRRRQSPGCRGRCPSPRRSPISRAMITGVSRRTRSPCGSRPESSRHSPGCRGRAPSPRRSPISRSITKAFS